ncbi:MAG TPA: EscU/YscU/HrcU family type III secretion system export apparatus switch protein, partial [Pirellulaceae bacterium]
EQAVGTTGARTVQVLTWVTVAGVCFGLVEFGWMRWRLSRNLRLTDHQWREAMRQLEGNRNVTRLRRGPRRSRLEP